MGHSDVLLSVRCVEGDAAFVTWFLFAPAMAVMLMMIMAVMMCAVSSREVWCIVSRKH